MPGQRSLTKLQQSLNLGMREGRSLLTEAKAISTNGSKRPFLKGPPREPRGTTQEAGQGQAVETYNEQKEMDLGF